MSSFEDAQLLMKSNDLEAKVATGTKKGSETCKKACEP